MVDEATNLIMEQLHLLRRGQDELQRTVAAIRTDVDDLKSRMTVIESNLAHLMIQYGHAQAQVAVQNGRLDRIESFMEHLGNRLSGVEHRLDAIDRRLDSVEHRFGGIESRLDRIGRRLDLHPA
jgi:chromosome segregation ATPase